MNIQSEFDFSATGGFCSAPSGVCAPPVQAGGGTFLKRCPKCNMLLDFSCFYKNHRTRDFLSSICKKCARKYEAQRAINNPDFRSYKNERKRIWRINNKEKNKQYNKKWRLDHKDKYRLYNKKRNKPTKQKRKEQKKRWKTNYPDKYIAQYRKEWQRRKSIAGERIKSALRCRLYGAIKSQSVKKTNHTMELLGCSVEFLWSHLESMFSDGMTRENYGKWHVDHIKPCASFDLSDPEQQRECFNYKNLQPLWAKDNLKKADKIIS